MSTEYLDKTGVLYLVTKIKALLSGKVDTVDGKGLSANDFTDTLLAKLNGIADSANNYTHPTLTRSDTTSAQSAAFGGKIDVVDSVTTDDDGHVSKINVKSVILPAEQSLSAYAKLASPAFTGTPTAPTASAGTNSTQIATTAFVSSAVASAVSGITGISYSIVTALPTTGKAGIIYLISNSGTAPNIYDEYIYVNSKFEKIGTTDVDLSGYLKTTDLVAVTNSEIDAMLA